MNETKVATEKPAGTEQPEPHTSISVVIPAYNEEASIKAVLHTLMQVLEEDGFAFEIIVVDDGSEDRTIDMVSSFPDVQFLQHHKNRGYGAALKTGIRQAKYETIVITDADGTYPNDIIPEMVEKMGREKLDMVVGARAGKEAAIPILRRPAKWMITHLAQTVVGEIIPDLNSGLRILQRSVLIRFFNMLPDGFSFTTTLTLGLLFNGYSIGYIPINYYMRKGRSKIRPVQDTLNFIQLVLQIALYFAPMKIFFPLSVILFLLGLTWGGVSYFLLGRIADVSMGVILMTAVQVGVVGLLADLVNRRLPSYQKDSNLHYPRKQ